MARLPGSPRTSRSAVPSASVLGLRRQRAQEDLDFLGWNTADNVHILWSLAAAGDPDMALNNVVRLVASLRDLESESAISSDASSATLLTSIKQDSSFRRRLFALFGASSLLGDHVVANAETWVELALPLPTREEMMDNMLRAVGAQLVEPAATDGEPGATTDAGPSPGVAVTPAMGTSPGAGENLTYKAAVTGGDADTALRSAYRSLLARVAAIDVASTTVVRGEQRPTALDYELLVHTLSDAADAALTAALAVACATVYGKPGTENEKQPARLAVIAMGKCGAQELNYISDVDVVFVAEPSDARSMRWAGEFINIGTRLFFEVDAGLRPEGKNGALVRTLESHISYYERWAKTWEFQALLKARPMSGDLQLGQQYCDAIAPMVWTAAEREDFVPDVQAMRRRVIENVPKDLRSRELKLGHGGLRDVEFAVQLLQLVHGRTDDTLRARDTVAALRALVDGGYVGREDGQTLIRSYTFLRMLEHRLQLMRLRPTHTLPPADDVSVRTWLAKTSGRAKARNERNPQFSLAEQLEADVCRTARQIQNLHRKLFYRPLLLSVVSMDADAIRLTPEAAKRQLAALGYENPQRAYEHLRALADGTSRKHKLQAILLPSLMEWLSETVDPDAGLLAYRRLSDAARDRTWFLRLLRDENIVGKRLMHLVGTSPYLADLYLQSVDSIKLLSDGANGPKLLEQDPAVVTHSLVTAANRQRDPDKAIGVARALRRAELARIAAADLLGLMPVEQVCESLSWVWDAVLEAALQTEIRTWEDEHQRNAPAVISVIGMGRLGGAELGYGSDADVMFVAEPVSQDAIGSTGDAEERAVEPGREVNGVASETEALKWATHICESVRRRLGKPTQDPPLEVDTGLRPEGRNGALVRTMESYERYYAQWAETWELQALLRATWIAGDKNLGIRFLHMLDKFRYPDGGATPKQVQEVRRMKARVDSERLPKGADKNLHTKLGRGGLSDVEWTAQLLTMQHSHESEHLRDTSTLGVLKEMAAAELISEADAATMREAWITATNARNAVTLVRGKRKDQLPSTGKPLALVAAAAGWPSEHSQEFLDDYLKKTRRARRVIDRVFWGEDLVDEIGEFDDAEFDHGGSDFSGSSFGDFSAGPSGERNGYDDAGLRPRRESRRLQGWTDKASVADRRDEAEREFRGRRHRGWYPVGSRFIGLGSKTLNYG